MVVHKDALTSVLLGYSVSRLSNTKIFIKHFGYTDSIESDYQYKCAFDHAVKSGAPTEKQRLEELKGLGLWTNQDEEIKSLESINKNLVTRKRSLALPSQVKEFEGRLAENESKLNKLKLERFILVGTTAETIAAQRSEDYYIYNSLYINDKFTKLFFEESFDDMDSDPLQSAKNCYYQSLKPIMGGGIRNIALCDEFMNLMNLTENAYEILGKPYAMYSFFQADLISIGRYYKMIINNDPAPPGQHRYNPDKLEEWWDAARNAKKIMSKTGKESMGGGSVLMGATGQDLKDVFGDDPNIKSIDSEIKKNAKGGVVKMEDMMRIHGVK